MRAITFFVWLIFITSLFAQSNEICMECHSDPDLTGINRQGQEVPMYVDEKVFQNSIHGDFNCIDCHTSLEGLEDFPHNEYLPEVNCGTCHEEVAEEYAQSMHGLKFLGHEERAPKCWDCHGTHNILPSDDSQSKTYFQNLANTCFDCHEKTFEAEKDTLLIRRPNFDYLEGVHGRLVAEGNDQAATCVSCHTAHSIRSKADPQSSVFRMKVAYTCGECHVEGLAEYSASIHFTAMNHGVLESATCIDCHGEHEILSPDEAYFKSANDACMACHNNPKLIQKYGLPQNRVSTYLDSYHGRSIKLGRENAATCASCHGNHEIHPASSPYSMVNPRNLEKTCAQCHDDVTPAFAVSYTHENMLVEAHSINYYIQLIYIILIVTVLGGMFVHNVIVYVRYVKKKKEEDNQLYIIRFKPAEVVQHLLLLTSFITLAVSGFALRFPDAWWVQIFQSMGIDEIARGWIHRVAAIVFVLDSLYHLYYLFFTPRGKREFRSMLFRLQDVRDFIQSMKYHLGLSHKKVPAGEFDYTEKAEYWALIWGGVVMGITGFVLWFPTLATSWLPAWSVRAAELIHYFEAILATGAIVVWHFFFVIFHPVQYPMNLAWLTGKMSLRAAVEKHSRWVEEVLQAGDPEHLLPEVIRNNCRSLQDVKDFLKFGPEFKEKRATV